MKYLKNIRGSILEYIIVVITISCIALKLMPSFSEAFQIRQEKTIQNYNGEDTITKY